mgnify:CR=1 FL=1
MPNKRSDIRPSTSNSEIHIIEYMYKATVILVDGKRIHITGKTHLEVTTEVHETFPQDRIAGLWIEDLRENTR